MTHLAITEGVVRALLFAKDRFNKRHYPYKKVVAKKLQKQSEDNKKMADSLGEIVNKFTPPVIFPKIADGDVNRLENCIGEYVFKSVLAF